MHYYKPFRFIILLLMSFLLTSCVTIQTQGTLPKDFQFNHEKPDEGVAAIIIGCNLNYGTLYTYIYDADKFLGREIVDTLFMDVRNELALSCTANQDITQMQTEVKLIKLPAGTYEFHFWEDEQRHHVEDGFESVDFPKVIFKVLPHKVTYIGGMLLSYGYHDHYRTLFYKPEAKDIPLIQGMLPAVSKKNIVMVPFAVKPNHDGW